MQPSYTRMISPYTQIVDGGRQKPTARLSRTCKQLHILMEDTLYGQLFSLYISSMHWSTVTILPEGSFEGFLAKARFVQVRVVLFLEQDFNKESEELEKAIIRLSKSKELSKFTFEVSISAYRVFERVRKERAIEERHRGLKTEVESLGLGEKERELKYAEMLLRFWKLRFNIIWLRKESLNEQGSWLVRSISARTKETAP